MVCLQMFVKAQWQIEKQELRLYREVAPNLDGRQYLTPHKGGKTTRIHNIP